MMLKIYQSYLLLLSHFFKNILKDTLAPRFSASVIFAMVVYSNFYVIYDLTVIQNFSKNIDLELLQSIRLIVAMSIFILLTFINYFISSRIDIAEYDNLRFIYKVIISCHVIISIIMLYIIPPKF